MGVHWWQPQKISFTTFPQSFPLKIRFLSLSLCSMHIFAISSHNLVSCPYSATQGCFRSRHHRSWTSHKLPSFKKVGLSSPSTFEIKLKKFFFLLPNSAPVSSSNHGKDGINTVDSAADGAVLPLEHCCAYKCGLQLPKISSVEIKYVWLNLNNCVLSFY